MLYAGTTMTYSYLGRLLIKPAIAILFACTSVPAQDGAAASAVSVDYDRFRNKTTESVTVTPKLAGGDERPRLFVEARFTYRGRKLGAVPRTFFFSLKWIGPLHFEAENGFIALVDGARVRLPDMMRYERRGYYEALGVDIPYRTFVRIAGAKKVEMQVGTAEFEFTDEAMKALRELAARAKP